MESANEDASAAVVVDDEEALRDALGRGADPNFRFRHFTLLSFASAVGFDGCCRLLLARGADPNLSEGGASPIHWACGSGEGPTRVAGKCECVRHLLDAGAEVDLCDERGDTALHHACGFRYVPIVKLLIQRGANIEAKTALDGSGFTPLGVAVACGAQNTALFLLRAGAKMNILKHQELNERNLNLNDYMIDIVNNDGGWAARARKHEDGCLRVVSRCVRLPRDVMLSIVSYWSLPH